MPRGPVDSSTEGPGKLPQRNQKEGVWADRRCHCPGSRQQKRTRAGRTEPAAEVQSRGQGVGLAGRMGAQLLAHWVRVAGGTLMEKLAVWARENW